MDFFCLSATANSKHKCVWSPKTPLHQPNPIDNSPHMQTCTTCGAGFDMKPTYLHPRAPSSTVLPLHTKMEYSLAPSLSFIPLLPSWNPYLFFFNIKPLLKPSHIYQRDRLWHISTSPIWRLDRCPSYHSRYLGSSHFWSLLLIRAST